MKKLLPLFSLLLMLGCEGTEGPAGPAGADGVANIITEVVQLTSMNTQYISYESNTGTSGYLLYEHETTYLPQAVLDSGQVIVEISPDDGDTWYSLPYILYNGDDTDVNYMYTCEYAYSEESVGISWWCSFDMSANDWVEIESLWANDYKITIFTPN